MPVISVLDPAVSELIAAGEVIERPASVIKELIENAIDAHATRITVEIKNGGTTFMRIVDDGDGMAREDVPTAFLRHATSKIAEKADLDTIMTLGFRGEALASVAAVARVTVMTKRREDDLGTRYEIAGVEQGEPEECGCPDGTSILVKDLFFNVPARRKFMKRDSAEGSAVAQIVQKIAISHPGIAFKFIRDNKLDFHSDGSGELLAAIRAVYGRDFAHDLIAVDHEQDGIHVKGYVVKPLYSKSSRSFQDFFVNTRYVRSRALSVALESAYENMVMTGKFPACVLLLDLPPDTLDVNIHPAKAEVRFTDEKGVINAVYFAVKNAMLQNGLIYEFQMPRRDWYAGAPAPTYEQQSLPAPPPAERPAYLPPVRETATPLEMPVEEMPQETAPVSSDMTQERAQETAPSSVPPRPQLDGGDMPFGMPAPRPRTEYADRSVPVSHFGDSKPPRAAIVQDSFVDMDAETDTQEFPAPPPQPQAAPALRVADPYPDIKVLGELFANYILAQSGDTFIIIDKHAAHERVIFERLRRQNCRQYRQLLLEPGHVLLTLDEFSAMESNTALLDRLGFSFDFTQKPCLIVTGAPVFFDGLDLDEIVQEVAHSLYLGKIDPQSHVLDDMLHEMACKSAIKANDRNSISELQALAEEVVSNEDIRHCPHGRPVMFIMTKYELERQFRRRV